MIFNFFIFYNKKMECLMRTPSRHHYSMRRKSAKKSVKRSVKRSVKKSRKLSAYNRFVQRHMHDKNLAHLEPKDKMRAIADMWHHHK